MQAFPIRDVHAGFLFYAPDQYEKLYPIMETYAREGVEDDPRTHMIQVFASNPSLNIDMAGFYTFYSEPFDTPAAAIKPFFDLPTTHRTTQNKTAKEANYEVTEGFEDGIRYDMQTYSVRADARLFKQLVDIWRFATAELDSTVTGWSSRIVYQTISKNMIRASDKKGGNVLGLQATGDPLVIVTYMFTWIRAEDDDKVYSGIDKLISTSTSLAESQNQLDDYIYLNYAGSGQKPIESYGLAQVKFLQRVKAKYDPEGVFEKLCRGGFKIPSQCSKVDDGYLNMQAGGSNEQTCSHFL
ncbi:hypothetical protein BN14_05853 [Rhizoctonia solani AG-1 IB]|uniref:Uncharacterized protein n=2 Tax=Thanatephorus cucumeris (strain AG1-IB / isolate 7/3/14) TaxID=1108050 RepID=M5BVU5_THACB|nr:hypothetical protein BN14_05853 [Rhizoctonia solani AG-1 IB]